jgi:hypothetical protein
MDVPGSRGWDLPPERLEPLDDAAGEAAREHPEIGLPQSNDIPDDGKVLLDPNDVPDDANDIPDDANDIPDQATGGYNRDDAAREDLRILVSGLDEVSRQLHELTVTLMGQQLSKQVDGQPDIVEETDLAGEIVSEVSRLSKTAHDLVAQGSNQEPDLAFSATAQMTVVRSDLRYARKRFSATSAWTKIWETLTRVAPRLWSLISHLVKVKEWSVTGQVGTGVFGLAQASISVTFG